MNQVGEWLCSRCPLMEIRSLSAEGVGGDYRLGLKAVSADGTAQLDLTQCRHDTLFHHSSIRQRKYLCHVEFDLKKLSLLLIISGQRIFSHPSSVLRSTPYHEPGC
jgi:hypothetical protein